MRSAPTLRPTWHGLTIGWEFGLQLFLPAYIVLIFLKILRLIDNSRHAFHAPSTGWLYHWKPVLFLGGDALSGLLFALLLTGPLLLLHRGTTPVDHPPDPPRLTGAAPHVILAVQLLHAAVAGLGVSCTIQLGGPLNKQAIDLLLLLLTTGDRTANQGLFASALDYLGVLTWLSVGGALLIAAGLTLACRRVRLRRQLWLQALLLLLLPAQLLLTYQFVPRAMRGEIPELRLYTDGLEQSPLLELVRSYLPRAAPPATGAPTNSGPFVSLDPPGATRAPVAPPLAEAVPRRTNVLWVLLESVGETYLEEQPPSMPYYAALDDPVPPEAAGEAPGGVTFAQHHASWILTTKALFSLLCSELDHPTFRPITYVNPAIPCRSLPEVLHAAGYSTLFVTSHDLAFDQQLQFLRHRKFERVVDSRTMPGRRPQDRLAWGIDDRVAVRTLLELLQQRDRSRPFFALFQLIAGHHPFFASPEHAAHPLPDRRQNYLRALQFVDERLQELDAGLARLGLLDQTLLVIVADHGQGHGRFYGRWVYEPQVRVPWALRGPQLGARRGRITEPTSHLDVAPTLLGLLGLPIPCTMRGRDLTRQGQPQLAYFGGMPPEFQLGVLDYPWKYIRDPTRGELLFDLQTDPAEAWNLAQQQPELARRYRARIEDWDHRGRIVIEDYAALLRQIGCRP